MKRQYFSLVQTGQTATLNIYGDIASYGDDCVNIKNLSKQLDEMQGVTQIDVFINSYGGEVAEGLAIYNALKRKGQTAKVTTYCDGFACSIASVVFMAGSERKMSKSSLLMIHNAWTYGVGNAEELRKIADDLEVITSASVEAYKSVANISEKKIKELMDNESWIKPKDAAKYGFATEIIEEKDEKVSQNVRNDLFSLIMSAKNAENDDLDEGEDKDKEEPEKEPETPEKDEKNDVKSEKKQFKCTECGYVYEGEELPEDYKCPECGSAEFEEVTEEPEDEPENKGDDEENPSEKIAGFFNAIFKI